jgi:23S rRNA (guanosine2251-2'-O)-methyltransferase
VRALEELKQHGFWVYGANMQAALTVSQMAWPERVVLVLGAESSGIRRLVRACCDSFVRIPMHAGTNSLNVATAGAIILAYRWDYCVTSCGQRQESVSVADKPLCH